MALIFVIFEIVIFEAQIAGGFLHTSLKRKSFMFNSGKD
ncbi:MAG: hypothetical protein JWR12_2073 [Mucilaginibacter sp.]|nr:hypothetical protein [Mucilaginibacter sp.]